MTLYPQAPYGQQHWGGYWAPSAGIDDVTSSKLRVQMTARSRNYNELIIGWSEPTDDYDTVALVRNTYGPPITLTDGVTVYKVSKGSVINRYFQDVGLTGGLFYSYSLFIHVSAATPHWQRVGVITAFVAKNYETGDDLFRMLPLYYQQGDRALVGPMVRLPLPQYVDEGPLQRFLNLVGYKYDEIRTEATNGLEVFSPEKLRADALLAAAATYGFPYEPYIGWRQVRLLWQNWAYILKTKGTRRGIEAFASAITGYGATAYLSKNLMLDANNSEALANVASWANVTTGATIARDTGPTPYGATVASFKVRAPTSGGPADFILRCGTITTKYDVRETGVPVTEGLIYALSFGASAATIVRDFAARISWYDGDGVFLSDDDGDDTTGAAAGSWLISGLPARPFVVAEAPAGAVYAIPAVIVRAGANSEFQYLTAFQFEILDDIADEPTSYEIAREINIVLEAGRVNIAPNPSIETNDDNWIVDSNCVVQRSSDFSYDGFASLRARSNVAGDFAFANVVLSVEFLEHDLYTFSTYIRQHSADILAGAQAFATVRWYSDPTVQDSSTLLATQVGSNMITIPGASWSSAPVSVTAQAPAGAQSAQGSITVTNAPPANLRIYVDATMWEKNGGIYPYFDGSTDPSSGEYLWEGTAENSASHHYSGKPLRNARLQALLPDFLPAFSSWRVLYAQPTS